MFLSIFLNNCKAENVERFFDNLANTASDLTSFEVLLRIDDQDYQLLKIIKDYQEKAAFNIKYITLPNYLYKSNTNDLNDLLKIAHKDSYFYWLLSDQVTIKTQHWDTLLKKLIRFYNDDVFRVKVSDFQLKNYMDIEDCLLFPEPYPILTRRWIEITEGWGNTQFVSSWHQCIDYYLGLSKNNTDIYGIWRSLPLVDVQLENASTLCNRKVKRQLENSKVQDHLSKLAAKLNAHISAISKEANEYVMHDDRSHKVISVLDINNSYRYKFCSYRLSKIQFQFYLGYKKLTAKHIFPNIWPIFKLASICIDLLILTARTAFIKCWPFYKKNTYLIYNGENLK